MKLLFFVDDLVSYREKATNLINIKTEKRVQPRLSDIRSPHKNQ